MWCLCALHCSVCVCVYARSKINFLPLLLMTSQLRTSISYKYVLNIIFYTPLNFDKVLPYFFYKYLFFITLTFFLPYINIPVSNLWYNIQVFSLHQDLSYFCGLMWGLFRYIIIFFFVTINITILHFIYYIPINKQNILLDYLPYCIFFFKK